MLVVFQKLLNRRTNGDKDVQLLHPHQAWGNHVTSNKLQEVNMLMFSM